MDAHAELHGLRHAIHALYYGTDSVQRRPADAWLQRFRATPGSWRACLQLLHLPGAADYEQLFAANSLKAACQRFQDVLEPPALGELVGQLALHTQLAVRQLNWANAAQLAAALAALAVRTPHWPPAQLLGNLQELLLSAGGGGAAPHGAYAPVPLAAASDGGAALLSLVCVLAALAEAVGCRDLALHPDRRSLVSDALLVSPWAAAPLCAALGSRAPTPVALACQTLHYWCQLGAPPFGLEARPGVVEVVAAAVVTPETRRHATDALCSLLGTCRAGGAAAAPGGLGIPPERTQLLHLLLQQVQATVLPAMVALSARGQAAALTHDHSGSPLQQQQQRLHAAMHGGGGGEAVEEEESAYCQVLCAAAGALLRPALLGGGQHLMLLSVLQQRLLACLGHPSDAVALIALDFWRDTYLPALGELPAGCAQQQSGVLEGLTAGVVARAQLTPGSVATATADARDLPEDIRMVRRALASALRDITALLGLGPMLRYMTQLVARCYASLPQSPGASGGDVSGLGTLPPWVMLEGAVYCANVVLGKRCAEADGEVVAQLMQLVAAAVTHPAGSLKLSGTALTLLGGLPAWYATHSAALAPALAAVLAALRGADPKLARNAATCVQRMCEDWELCVMLVSEHGGWVNALLAEYQRLGGQCARAAQGDDMPTEELMLLALCNLAVAAAPGGSASAGSSSSSSAEVSSILLQLVGPQLTAARAELETLLVASGGGAGGPQALAALQGASGMRTTGALVHAVGCFKTLTALVTGLPTAPLEGASAGADKGRKRHPHGQALQQRAQHGGSGGSGGSPPRASSVVAQSETGAGGGGGGQDGSAWLPNARMQPQQLQAGRIVLQLLLRCWDVLQLALMLGGASHLPQSAAMLSAACSFLATSLTHAAVAAKANASLPPPPPVGPGAAGGLPTPEVLLLQLLRQLHRLPPRALQSPCCLQLLGACISAAAASCLLAPAPGAQSPQSPQSPPPQQQQQHAAGAAPPLVLAALQAHLAAVLPSAARTVCALDGRADPGHVVALLRLAATAVRLSPASLAAADVAPLLAMTQLACATYHSEQALATLDWCQAMVAAVYAPAAQPPPAAGACSEAEVDPRARCNCSCSGRGGARSSWDAAALTVLRTHLEAGGQGPRVVLSLLLAAAGDMAPDMVLPISTCLHAMWGAAGTPCFRGWLEVAVINLAPEGAPWVRQKQSGKAAFVAELTDPLCASDVARFKRLVKLFAGGKKKRR